MTLIVSITMERHYRVVWCMGVANNYTCYHQLYRLVPVLLHLFSNLVPVLFIPFQLYPFSFLENFYMSSGVNVSLQNDHNRTALHYACGQQSTVRVEFLLATGADSNIQDANGGIPLMLACYMKGDARDAAILVMLLSVGANPNIQTENDGPKASSHDRSS